MMNLKSEIADIKRFKEIVKVILEENLTFILEHTKLYKFLPLSKRLLKGKVAKVKNEVKLRRAFERLGPTFIKFGQLLSVRPDIVPKSYIKELEKLQDSVPPFHFSEAKKIIEESTGKRLKEIFKSFEKKPIASASIAQVYKAILKDGTKVAVKVRRPKIEEIIQRDIELMLFIAGLIEKHIKTLKRFRAVSIVQEFASWTKKEMNFLIETENMQRFYEHFKDSKTTKIPKAYVEYCSEKVIIMEYIDGIELHKLDKSKKGLEQIIKNGFYSILEQVFVYGLFHADPHPSNIIVLKDNRIALVDFGIVGRFDEQLRSQAVDLFIGMTEGDVDKVAEIIMQLGEIDQEKDVREFKLKISDAISHLQKSQLKDVKISRILEDVFDVSSEFGVRMPLEFVLFGKTIVTIEGIGLLYSPNFKFAEMAQPFIKQLLMEKYQPKKLFTDTLKTIFNLRKIFEKLPEQATRVLDKIEKGEIQIEMHDTDVEKLSVEIDKSSNRLTYGMIIAALLVSGSLLINVGDKIFFGLSLFSFLCFLAAGVLMLMLLVSILREKRR